MTMLTRVSTSQTFDRPSLMMAGLSRQADTLQTQIATGKKLLSPADDPTAFSRLATLTRSGASDQAYGANIGLAKSMLAQSDSVLSTIGNQLQHAQELALQAANGTLSDSDRAATVQSLNAMVDDLVTLANTRDVRDQPMFGGATGDTAYVRAADGSVSFAGSGDPAAIPIGADATIRAADSGERIFGGIDDGQGGTTDMFAILRSLSTALSTGGDGVGAASAAALDGIKAALTQVTNAQASVGARAARLDIESNQMTASADARESARSAIEDVDITTAITQLQRTMTVLQATQASFTKLSALSLFDYLR